MKSKQRRTAGPREAGNCAQGIAKENRTAGKHAENGPSARRPTPIMSYAVPVDGNM